MKHLKTFLAAMLLLVGSNYAGAATNWATFAANNAATPAAGDYYLYNANSSRKFFATIKVTRSSSTGAVSSVGFAGSADVNQAALFTLSGTFLTAVKFQLTEQIEGKTYYLNGTGTSFSTSSATRKIEAVSNKTYYYIRNTKSPTNYYLYLSSTGSGSTGVKSNTGTTWYFIPAACIHNLVSVTGLNANGSMTIDTPTGSATANVKFNVSGDGPVSAFNIELSGGDGHFVMGTATRSGNVITVPVTYTAQNRHSGTSTPASTATVTITAKNEAATTASGTVSAYVDLEPRFAMAVSSLDWSHTGLNGEEIFYKGQEIAASQRDRLANKLVYVAASTTGTAKSNATWTATITGTNYDQFKFANGTQTVSGKYTASLLDVIYAPTTTSDPTHNATLHIVTSYKDASNHTETVEHDIALSGKGSADARIAFAKAGSQLPSDAESHNFGEIIGTNQQEITAELYLYQITNPQMVWDDPAGQFVFINQGSVDLSLHSQTLSFRAKRTSPVEEETMHMATLTVSGKGPANEDVSGTLTLTYTALPLTQPTVTWNWATIREGLTAYNPITTNSDGVWMLTKTAGDKLTYNPATKSATAEYLHHEPGKSGAFYLQIPQTDTYAAFEGEYETAIDVSPVPEIRLETNAQFTDPSFMTYKVSTASYVYFEPTQNKLTIWDGGWVEFMTAGQNVISFRYDDDDSEDSNIAAWTVTEYYANNTSKVIYQDVVLTSGEEVTWQFSPNATKIRIEDKDDWGNNSFFTNVRISEYDVIAADAEIVALIDDNGTVSDRDVTLTFANKRQVTATLNETAAQYFTIVDATPAAAAPEINLTEEVFNNSSLVAYSTDCFGACAEFDASANKLSNAGWIDFMNLSGQSKISFYYEDDESFFGPSDPLWTVTEYIGDAANVIYEGVDLTSGTNVTWSFSPNATKIRIEDTENEGGLFTNVRIYGEAVSGGGGEPGSSVVYDSEDGLGVGKVVEGKVITVALKGGVTLADAKEATAGNACQLVLEDDYTYDHEVLMLPIAIVSPCDITYKHSDYGTYVITYQGEDPRTVGESFVQHIGEPTPSLYAVTLSAPTPASGYQFQGWKINGVTVSCKESFTTSITVTCEVEAAFVAVEAQNFKVGEVYFADMGAALTAAGTSSDSKIVTQMQDVTLGDGTTPIEYIVPAGVTLLVPHKANFFELQETPEIVNTIEVLSAYRTLTLKEGVTITCNGNICISGKLMSSGGGNKSAYTTGECGVINMANGGHIELNNGAHLYCWGYIKGQDMDQGNNTVGTGTVTANSGATVWENFELGDWRGGTASFNIYYNNETEHRKLFPFQSYALQNVEIPTSFMHGSTLRTFTSITTGFGHHDAVFSMVGPENTMFLLTDEQSVVRMWYDPTTDLSCYELSGTAKLDALHVTVYVDMSSENFILPISNSMHIILKDCNMNLANPLMVQAGAIVEIKPSATVNLTSELYLYDVDQWGKYVHNYYFRSFNNLSSHKDRGAENSKAGLDDAKLIVDGIFNIQNGGKLYTTAGGANVMGNGGGQISFKSALPADNILWAVTVLSGAPYINWEYNDVKAANLCNEDGTYTKSYGGYTFYNVHGRWFDNENNNEKADHTYDFSYYPTNDVSGEETWTSAVYSHDKTGLEARMKWFNVVRTADNCTDVEDDLDKPFTSNWWIGTNPTAYYNHTMLNEWHQFMATETEGVYSGSDNKLYQKEECLWFEEAAVDENCLYTIDGVKKALVTGEFIPLTSNGYDPAYHQTDDASKYFICFAGCNWHPATPYAGESKAYTINPETGVYLHYIWFNNDWLNVLRNEPFFYTEDEQTNVRTYYEYINGEWEIATPYVSVRDAAETRTFYMIKEAFNVAQIKKDATITLLRDLPNVSEVLSYATQNTTCTLDLNGHVLGGTVANLVTVNAPGCTFTITDNAALKIGKITTTASKAVYAQKGTVVLSNGTLEATGTNAIECASTGSITINGGYLSAATKCVNVSGSCSISGGHFTDNTGLATYCAANKYPFETTDPKYKYEVSAAWTITFVNEATTLQTLHVKPGETPAYTEAQPTKDGYKFTGWSPAIAAATKDQTYTAQFTTKAAEERCVTLNSNGGDQGLQYIYVASGSAIGTLPETTKDGHTFAGWFDAANGGTQITTATIVSTDVTWYAHYNKNTYTLTWDANGGQLSGGTPGGSVQYGAAITAPTATKAGHTFLGWNVTPAATMPAHDVTYTAQWSVLVKHYQQNLDGSYPASPEATENVSGEASAYVTPAAKTYDGFITPPTQTVQIGVTTEVTYQYARRVYTITFNANGGECATASLEVKHGATLGESMPEATKEGHSFDGWFTKTIGGDQITDATIIQRNIGTLYAHFTELVTPETVIIVGNNEKLTITDPNMEATALIVEKDGIASFATGGHLTVDRLILESTGNQSGQLVGLTASNLTVTGDVFFDFIPNGETGTQARTWYAIAVPWEVDAENGIFWKEGNRQLIIGRDFDLIYYDVEERASVGNKPSCWKYVQHQSDKIMHPGRLYMMYFDPGWKTIRFKAQDHSALIAAAPGVEHHDAVTGQTTDANWNGIANPAVYHAYLNASGITYAQVLNNGNLDDYQTHNEQSPVYSTITFNTYRFVVGKPVFVQATNDVAVSITPAVAPSLAPRRVRAAGVPEGVEAVYQLTVAAEGRPSTDNLFIQTAEEKADAYVIGKDLAKGGVAKNNAQLWVNRYGVKLSVNTVAAANGVHEYPLGLSIPTAGEYTIAIESAMGATEDLYLTRDGEAIWNLSNGAYVGSFEKGTHDNYGLRVSAHAPQITTGIDEAVVDAKGETRKVVINDKVYIIRGEHIYSADGQLVK